MRNSTSVSEAVIPQSHVEEQVQTKSSNNQRGSKGPGTVVAPPEFRFIYPEFLPDPKVERRNKLREKLERMDMLQRRSAIDIPEFYTGLVFSNIYL